MTQSATHSASKAKLIKRLRYLWTWELFDSFFLPAVMIFILRYRGFRVGYFTAYAMGLTVLLLWQGAAYWWLKLRSVREGKPLVGTWLRVYAVLKKVNWGLLALAPLLMTISLRLPGRQRIVDVVGGALFTTLALLEQVNYYYVQLMYDSPTDWRYLTQHKRLKRASLARDLAQWRNASS